MKFEDDFYVEKAGEKDSRGIWEIRYHPEINQVAFNKEIVDFFLHDEWYKKKYFEDARNKCFVLKQEDKVVGYIRLDKNNGEEFLISVAILPKFQGMGLGRFLLSESLSQFKQGDVFLAEIRINNVGSLNLFQKSGFVIFQENKDEYSLKRII